MAVYGQAVTIEYVAWDLASQDWATGDSANHTLRWVKDGVPAVATNSPAEVDATNAPGVYKIVITAAEAKCKVGMLCGKSATTGVMIAPICIDFTDSGETASVAAVIAGSAITITRGETTTITLTDLGDISGRTKLWFTAKSDRREADSQAIIQAEETAGLIYLNGATPTAGQTATWTISDENAGDLTIVLTAAATAALGIVEDGYWDVQMLTATAVVTLTVGVFDVDLDVTRAIT